MATKQTDHLSEFENNRRIRSKLPSANQQVTCAPVPCSLARSTKLIATAQESFAHQQTLLTFTLRYDRKLPGLIRDVNIEA